MGNLFSGKQSEKIFSAPPELMLEQFWDISDHLTVAKSFDVIDDVYRIRAIFRWMTSFDIESIMTQILPPDSCPLEYLIKIQSDFGDHAHLLYVLCVAANIPCVVINGMTKHGFYEVGDDLNRDALLSKWNAVYINGEWWLIDPHWASSIPEGTYRDQIFVDEEGNISVTDELGNKNGVDRPVNEFFFLCDPKKLIWTHFPDEPKWQLLEEPIDEETFKNQPYLREYFHIMDLKISPDYRETGHCVLRPDGRPSRIAFDLPPGKSKDYLFKFTISEVDVEIGDERDPSELERNIMMEKSDTQLKLTARFPYVGRFQLDIYGFDVKSERTFRLLCTYLIDCGKACKNCKGFPKVPEYGWGPHPLAQQIGLTPISPKSNVIQTETGIVEVRLPSSMCNNMCHALKSVDIDDAMLTNHAVGRFDEEQYFVNIRLPEEGEYTLEIFADVDALRGKLPDTKVMTFLIEFYGTATNAPFPVVLGSHLGSKPGAKKLKIEPNENPNGVVVAWDGKLSLGFKSPSHVAMFNELSSNDSVSKKLMKIEDKQEEDSWTFNLDLPVAGIYSLNLYACDNSVSQKKIEEVFSYLIQSTGYITKEELEAKRKTRKNKRRNRSSSRSPRRSDDLEGDRKGGKTPDDNAIALTAKANVQDNSAASAMDEGGFDSFLTGENLIISNKAAPAATAFGRHTSSAQSKKGDKTADTKGVGKPKPGTENGQRKNNNPISLRKNISGGKTSKDNGTANSQVQRSKTQGSMRGGGQTKQNGIQTNLQSSKNAANTKGKTAKDKSKSVTFGNQALGSLIIRTYETTENVIHIPIEQALNTIFTSIKRRDANEKHGDKIMVVKRNEGLEVRIKGYGEYQLDVMWKGEGTEINMVGRYTVIRKPPRGLKKTKSETASALFGSGFVDASVWNSDGTREEDEKKKGDKSDVISISVEPEKIVPDLRSIKTTDMYDDDMQERFTEATNREMMSKLRKNMNVRDLSLVLKCMELYQSTTKTARTAFPPSLQNVIKKIKNHQKVVLECRMEEPVVIEEVVEMKKRSDEKGMLELTISVAHKIIDRLTRKEKRTKIELGINQITLTEIKQYSSPPEGVHECIMATLLLLGDNIEDLKDFSACQGLLFRTGNNYIMRRISKFNPGAVPQIVWTWPEGCWKVTLSGRSWRSAKERRRSLCGFEQCCKNMRTESAHQPGCHVVPQPNLVPLEEWHQDQQFCLNISVGEMEQ
ncbi:hypothetical protein FSP39_022723 [Pinctada imbricata]|uniref:KY-like immunoglobulin-like domain-containing protein n=1 Tax=Pinctada imbricata TaxID=66713 RepID=A0AA88Y149_PINIB|nr:hypothetical protein FSP39_022723 [Pinctada imbricata]